MHVTPHEHGVRCARWLEPRGIARRGGHRSDAYPRYRASRLSIGQGRGGRACWSRHDRDGHGTRRRTGRPSKGSAKAGAPRTKDLGGEQEAHGRVGHRSSATAVDGTDPTAEQSLEGGLDAGCALKGASGNADPGGASSATGERQEGRGPGDRVRLVSDGILRGVGAAREREVRPGDRADGPETRRTPRLAAGCNKPATLRRSKPAR
jgi:hypothetical protein